jgi:hypothetical protein
LGAEEDSKDGLNKGLKQGTWVLGSSKARKKMDLASMMKVRGKFWFLLLWPCFAAETSMMILFLDIIPAALIPL